MENKLVAKIEHLTNGNIITSFEDESTFSEFNTLESKCEVCGTKRFRNLTYIVRNENGKLIQVGSSCIDKLIPTIKNPKSLSREEQFILKGGINNLLVVRNVIYNIIKFNLQPNEIEYTYEFKDLIRNNERVEEIEKIIEFYKNLETSNDFEFKVRTLVLEEIVERKHINLLKWAYKIYQNHQIKVSSNGLNSDTFIVKKIEVAKKYCDTRYSYYGVDKIVYRIIDENDNIIEYDTARELKTDELLDQKVSCKIKKSYDSRLGKITTIKNLKCC